MRATFPHLALQQAVQLHLAGQSLETQESISGSETVVPTMRGRWKATANFAFTRGQAALQWQAFMAQMQGRIGTTLVPTFYRERTYDRDGHGLPFCDVVGLADAETWEHFGFENTGIVRVRTKSAAALRATVIDLELVNSTGVRPGQFFSIGERLHRIQAHWQPDASTYRVMIEPPLRAAVSVGTRVEVEKPVCLMRMVSETEGLFDQALDVLPSVSVNFVEAL